MKIPLGVLLLLQAAALGAAVATIADDTGTDTKDTPVQITAADPTPTPIDRDPCIACGRG